MIVALHGAVGSTEDWKPLPENGNWQCLNLWKFLQCCPKPLPELAKAINHEFPRGSNTLVGYSMGGRIALHALLDPASTWEKAVIISAHTGLKSEQERSARRSLDAEWASKALSKDWDAFIEEWNQQAILSNATMPNRSDLKPWRRQIARSFIDWSTGSQEDLLPRLSEIKIPILWITGENDKKFENLAQKAITRIPKATHISLPECGHRIPWQQRDLLYKKITDFARSKIKA